MAPHMISPLLIQIRDQPIPGLDGFEDERIHPLLFQELHPIAPEGLGSFFRIEFIDPLPGDDPLLDCYKFISPVLGAVFFIFVGDGGLLLSIADGGQSACRYSQTFQIPLGAIRPLLTEC